MSKIVQCELRSCNGPQSTHLSAASLTNGPKTGPTKVMVTWLDDKGLKPGDKVTLQDMPGQWWEIQTMSRPHERSDIKRGWGMTDYYGAVPTEVSKVR